MSTNVLVTLDLAPQILDRIRAVDPSLNVRALAAGTRASFGGRLPYPSELQATAPAAEIEAALAEADILYSSWAGVLPDLDLPSLAPNLRWVQLLHAGAERVNPSLIGDLDKGSNAATPTEIAVRARQDSSLADDWLNDEKPVSRLPRARLADPSAAPVSQPAPKPTAATSTLDVSMR